LSDLKCGLCGGKTDAFICWDCTGAFRDELRKVPGLVAQIETTIAKLDAMNAPSARVHGQGEEPAVWNDRASQVLAKLRNELVCAVRELCEDRKVAYIPLGFHVRTDFIGPLMVGVKRVPRHHVDTTNGVALWLAQYVTSVMYSEGAAETVTNIRYRIKQARNVTDRPRDRAYIGKCKGITEDALCDEDVFVYDNAEYVRCHSCGTTHDVGIRKAAAFEEARMMHGTATEIARLLPHFAQKPIRENTIRKWAERGLILGFKDGWGRTVYRIGDVIDRHVKQHANRESA
jgi:hypothetical protein